MSARTQRAEAREIIRTCTAETWRPLVAWAVGVWVAQHAMHFYTLPKTPGSLAPEGSGGSDGNRHWDADRQGFRVWEFAETGWPAAVLAGQPVQRITLLTLKWREVECLVTVDLVGAALHQQIRSAMDVRRERTPIWDPRKPSSWRHTAEAERENRLWAEIEAQCYELGALAWRRCRPVRTAAAPATTQLSLFAA